MTSKAIELPPRRVKILKMLKPVCIRHFRSCYGVCLRDKEDWYRIIHSASTRSYGLDDDVVDEYVDGVVEDQPCVHKNSGYNVCALCQPCHDTVFHTQIVVQIEYLIASCAITVSSDL